MKHLVEVRGKNLESDLVIIGFNVWEDSKGDERAKSIKKYIEKNKINYSVVLGNDKTATDFKVEGVPDALLISPEGKVVMQGHPVEEDFNKKLDEQVAELKKSKMKAIEDSLDGGTYSLKIMVGKGAVSSLSEPPKEFKWLKVAGGEYELNGRKGKLTDEQKSDIRQKFHGYFKPGEESKAKADEQSVYMFLKAKGGETFMFTMTLAEAYADVKQLLAKFELDK